MSSRLQAKDRETSGALLYLHERASLSQERPVNGRGAEHPPLPEDGWSWSTSRQKVARSTSGLVTLSVFALRTNITNPPPKNLLFFYFKQIITAPLPFFL